MQTFFSTPQCTQVIKVSIIRSTAISDINQYRLILEAEISVLYRSENTVSGQQVLVVTSDTWNPTYCVSRFMFNPQNTDILKWVAMKPIDSRKAYSLFSLPADSEAFFPPLFPPRFQRAMCSSLNPLGRGLHMSVEPALRVALQGATDAMSNVHKRVCCLSACPASSPSDSATLRFTDDVFVMGTAAFAFSSALLFIFFFCTR